MQAYERHHNGGSAVFSRMYCLLWLCPPRKRSSGELSESCASTLTPDPDNLLGLRIQHTWREKGNLTTWKGTVLERLTVRNTLYMVKYDGFDCVYGIELFKDERVSNLQVLSEKVGESGRASVSGQGM